MNEPVKIVYNHNLSRLKQKKGQNLNLQTQTISLLLANSQKYPKNTSNPSQNDSDYSSKIVTPYEQRGNVIISLT